MPRIVFAVVLCWVTPLWAATHTVRVVRIADSSTPVPGGIGRFQTFGPYLCGTLVGPRLDDGKVAFVGQDEKSHEGLYLYVDGEIRVVADRGTPVPNAPIDGTNFVRFCGTAFDSGLLAFRGTGGRGSFPGPSGVYAYHTGDATLERVADNAAPVPAEGVRFNGFEPRLATDSEAVLFAANWFTDPNQLHRGLFLAIDDQIELLFDQDTVNPSTGQLLGTTSLRHALALDGHNVAFVYPEAVLVYRGRTFETVADFSTAIPEGRGTFTAFNPISIAMDEGLVFLDGLRTSPAVPFQHGLYLWRDGLLERVVDLATPIPDGPDGFLSFAWPSLDAGNVAFRGDTRPQGLFARIDGVWVTILAPLAPLEGGLVPSTVVPSGIDGRQIAFVARFGTGGEALYLATIENGN